MTFEVFSDPSRARLIGGFTTIEEALAALTRNAVLVLPPDFQPVQPLAILIDAITIETSEPGLSVDLGPGVSNFFLTGSAAAVVRTSSPVTNVWGNDAGVTLYGGAGRDMAWGGASADSLFGGQGEDVLRGGAGDDLIVSGSGRDQIFGGDGDDLMAAADGRKTLAGGQGADTFLIDADGTQTVILTDFDAAAGDRLMIGGMEADELAAFLSGARVWNGSGQALLSSGGLTIQVFGADTSVFAGANFAAVTDADAPQFADFDSFVESGLAGIVDRVMIGDTLWRLREGEPLHEDFRGQDTDGNWWSPDYLVVVAAGQSNMLGAGWGGDTTLSGNVTAWDWVNGALVDAAYDAAPAGGEGVRTGTALRNNLYYPFAEELAASSGRPVLVIAHPASGSRIDSWLSSRDGTHWATLETDIANALAAIGQNGVDAFLWQQGESDFPMPTAEYQARMIEFIGQVQGADWAGAAMQMLVGELSRLGVNHAQNAALQAIELMDLPGVSFVSSTGLTVMDEAGVHFDGPGLVEFGQRFFDAWVAAQSGADPAPNTAPALTAAAAGPSAITILEGDSLTLDLAAYFTDAEGDPLWFFGHLDQRGVYLTGNDGGALTLSPDYLAAGSYTLTVFANDWHLDSDGMQIALTVIDRDPGLAVHQNGDFTMLLDYRRDVGVAQDDLRSNRGLDILLQEALDPGGNLLIHDSLHIRGAAGMTGAFTQGEGVLRSYLYGDAAFDVTGNALDNLIKGNDAGNVIAAGDGRDRVWGGAGDDILSGGAGDDRLFGDDGNDLLDAGPGADQAWGGAGADVFLFEAGDGSLMARDFTAGEDVLRLTGFAGVDDFADLQAAASIFQSDDRVVIDLAGDRLIVYGVTVETLSSDMFGFV